MESVPRNCTEVRDVTCSVCSLMYANIYVCHKSQSAIHKSSVSRESFRHAHTTFMPIVWEVLISGQAVENGPIIMHRVSDELL